MVQEKLSTDESWKHERTLKQIAMDFPGLSKYIMGRISDSSRAQLAFRAFEESTWLHKFLFISALQFVSSNYVQLKVLTKGQFMRQTSHIVTNNSLRTSSLIVAIDEGLERMPNLVTDPLDRLSYKHLPQSPAPQDALSQGPHDWEMLLWSYTWCTSTILLLRRRINTWQIYDGLLHTLLRFSQNL